eukprot:3495422-Pleurochrysis_carterae.AAC.1
MRRTRRVALPYVTRHERRALNENVQRKRCHVKAAPRESCGPSTATKEGSGPSAALKSRAQWHGDGKYLTGVHPLLHCYGHRTTASGVRIMHGQPRPLRGSELARWVIRRGQT